MIAVDPRELLAELFQAAVAAADPAGLMAAHLPSPPKGRTVVVGAGKAAASMARALEGLSTAALEGVVVVPYGHNVGSGPIRVIEASHPTPDAAGIAASEALFDAVAGLTADDLVIALVSGGGSALLVAPPAGLSLEDEVRLNQVLLVSGLSISDMNLIRRHVSRIKGGRLALAAAPARVVSFVVSDIPGDDPALVASGPTLPSIGTREAALTVVREAGLGEALGERLMDWLGREAADAPSPQDPQFANHQVHVVASARLSLERAADLARRRGLDAVVMSDCIEGEAELVGADHAAAARNALQEGRSVLLLSGGETTVTATGGAGRGGRNTEFALSAALRLNGLEGVIGLAADTDGVDGSSGAAGAWFDGGTVLRVQEAGLDPAASLAAHDSATALEVSGDLFVTGPTGTNVNDFRAVLVTP